MRYKCERPDLCGVTSCEGLQPSFSTIRTAKGCAALSRRTNVSWRLTGYDSSEEELEGVFLYRVPLVR